MEIREITYPDARPVEGYGPGFFRIGAERMEGALLVTASAARGWQGLDDTAPLLALAGEVDVILLGTGNAMLGVPAALTRSIEAAGMGLEPMASPTACRTYNMLLAEGRRVALAVLPVTEID